MELDRYDFIIISRNTVSPFPLSSKVVVNRRPSGNITNIRDQIYCKSTNRPSQISNVDIDKSNAGLMGEDY